jgi:phage FluMu protein Com
MSEQWTDVRCIACVPLGWYSSRLLLRINGVMNANGVKLEMRCPRCRSLIEWTFGKPEFKILYEGRKNDKKQTAVFE